MDNKAQEDLKHIRDLMERSSKFLSLSGLSGVFAGIFALFGVGTIMIILDYHNIDYFDGKQDFYTWNAIIQIGTVLGITLVSSLTVAFYFTHRKVKREQRNLWTYASKELFLQLSIPLICGGLICLLLIYHNFFYFVTPTTLIFYGLAATNASKYTFSELFWLGIIEICLGLLSLLFIGYGLVFWALGFGVLHIIYGVLMYKKYDLK